MEIFKMFGSIFIKDEATDTLKKTEKQVKKTENKMNNSFGKIGKAAAALGAVFVATFAVSFAKNAINAASDAAEMQSKFETVFGNIGDDAEKWTKDFQKAVGGSRNEIKGAIADSQDMLTGFGLTTKEAFKVSTQIQQLGTDLASFQNLSGGAAEGVDRLRKGLLGETENLKAMGIVINQTNSAQKALELGFTESFTTLTEAQKIQVRYALAVEQSKNAIGDAERTSKGYANQVRNLKGRLADMQAEIGEKLLPIMTELVNWVVESVIPSFESIGAKGVEIWQEIQPVIKNFIDIYGPIFKEFFEAIYNLIRAVAPIFKIVFDKLAPILKPILESLEMIFRSSMKVITDITETVTAAFEGDWRKVIDNVKNMFSELLSDARKKFRAISKIRSSVSSITTPGAIVTGGAKSLVKKIRQKIPGLATGGNVIGSGATLIGEKGPEILDLPKGSRVTPLDKTNGVTVVIQNPKVFGMDDVNKMGDALVKTLRRKGVVPA